MKVSIGPYVDCNSQEREISIHIDKWDTWSMDHTLALIILPMLKQLRETKHGAPWTDDGDVPEELRSTSAPPKQNEYDTDDNHFKRWDWILDEMIWAFEQIAADDSEAQFYNFDGEDYLDLESSKKLKIDREGLEKHEKRIVNGTRLFGRYYQNLWD